MPKKISAFIILALLCLSHPSTVKADSELETKFQDMFVTAGYSAAAGAAIGAALLTFQDNPTRHLKFISVGASLGFLGGTALGAWYTVAPAFVENGRPEAQPIAASEQRVVIRPWIDLNSQKLAGIETGAILARF